MTGATSVGASPPTSNLSPTNRRNHGTSNPSSAGGTKLSCRIPEVAEAAVIEDFYRGSNDSAFVRAILQKAPTTSEQLFQ
jgi:hypothetical protein